MEVILKSAKKVLYKFALNVVKCGKIPRHVAFIMDGNRRYAAKNKLKNATGHSKGTDRPTLGVTFRVCLDLGVKEITYYAFSIDNFSRSQDEVDFLLDMAREKIRQLLDEGTNLLDERGVCIRVIGNLSLLPLDLVKLIAKAMVLTRNNNRARLNIAIPYTSRDEITEATKNVIEALEEGTLLPDDVTPELLGAVMYTEDSFPPDLLIRTSGDERLSDFLLWQTTHSVLYFTPVLWPDFTFWGLFRAVIQYQRGQPKRPSVTPLNCRMESFLVNLYRSRFAALTALLPSED